MRALEIKIKWIKRKQMTHENTYRDDIFFIFWTHLAPVLLTVKRDILIVHTRVIFCCSPTMHWSFNTRRRVHSIPGRRRRRTPVIPLFDLNWTGNTTLNFSWLYTTCIESALIISPLNNRQISNASLDFPEPVAPRTTTSGNRLEADMLFSQLFPLYWEPGHVRNSTKLTLKSPIWNYLIRIMKVSGKTTLKFMSCDHLAIGDSHPVWKLPIRSRPGVRKGIVKSRIIRWLVKVVTRARVRFQIRTFFITSLLRH